MRSVFVIFVSIAMAPFAMAQLELAAPEEGGLSGARLSKVMEFVRRDIGSGKIAGAVTLISRYGKIVHFDTAGTYGLDDKRAMEKDTLFRIYSMTKPITTVAAMMLYEEGRFQMGDPFSKSLTVSFFRSFLSLPKIRRLWAIFVFAKSVSISRP